MGKFPTISRTSCTLPRLLGKHSMLSLIGKPCVGHVRENHLIFLIVFPKFRTCDIMCSIQDSSACMDPQPSTPMHPARIPQQESSSPLRSHRFHKPRVCSQEFSANEISASCRQPGFSAMLAHARILMQLCCLLFVAKETMEKLPLPGMPPCSKHEKHKMHHGEHKMIATKFRELCLLRQLVSNPLGLQRMCLL